MTDDTGYKTLYVVLRKGGVPKPLYVKRHTPQSGDAGAVECSALFLAGLPLVLAGPQLSKLLDIFGSVSKVSICSVLGLRRVPAALSWTRN
jgi:hypothetical protein